MPMTRDHLFRSSWLATLLALPALGAVGCATLSGTATSTFEDQHKCNAAVATERPDLGSGTYEVNGCGTKALYGCSSAETHRGNLMVCSELIVHTFEATDGSLRKGALSQFRFDGPAQEDALLASAVHDLPCDRTAITRASKGSSEPSLRWARFEDDSILEGCGQRVTYHWTYDDQKNSGRPVLIGKVATGTPSPGPPPAAP